GAVLSGAMDPFGVGSGVGIRVTGGITVALIGVGVQHYAVGLMANSPTGALFLADVPLKGNGQGGNVSGVSTLALVGTAASEVFRASGTQIFHDQDQAITYGGLSNLQFYGQAGDDFFAILPTP